MKRLFVIFLSVFYLVLATGFTRYTHLCQGASVKQLTLYNTLQHADKPCPICQEKNKQLVDKKKDCCKQEQEFVKVDDSAKNQSHSDFVVKLWGTVIANRMLGALFDPAIIDAARKNNYAHLARYPAWGNPLYILHCTYRI